MKRTLVASIIFVLLISLAVLEMFYIKKIIEDLNENVIKLYDNIEQNPENIKTEKNSKHIKDIADKWDKDKRNLYLLLPHNTVNELTIKISMLQQHIHQNDYNMANTAAALIIKNCEVLLEYFNPNFQNIV